MIDFEIIQQNFLALAYVLLILFVQSIFEETLLPRLSFSKTTTGSLRQMIVRWLLFARRVDFEFRRDILTLLKVAVLLAAVAVLPLNGISGLRVERPDLVIAQLMSVFYFMRVFCGWRRGISGGWEKSLEEILFGSSRILVFLLIVDSAYLNSDPDNFRKLLGTDWFIFSGAFPPLAFLLGIVLVGFFQGRQEYKKQLSGLALFAWKTESVLWISLLLVTFLNTAAIPGPAFFLSLSLKCSGVIFLIELVRSHMPKMRLDQFERMGLVMIYPLAILIFMGMWWQETFK